MVNCSKQRLLKVVSIGEEEENIIELGMFEGLNQLRYLHLRGKLSDERDQEFLEKVIGKMKFLQTLNISSLKEFDGGDFDFPKCAWNIKTLRHLSYNPLELPASAKLTNLQTICIVEASQSWEIELPHTPNLRSLDIDTTSSTSKAVIHFLSTLKHLTNLWIGHDHTVPNVLDMRGFPFYQHLQSLTLFYREGPTKFTLHEDMLPCHLIRLQITGHMFQHDIMPVIEKLHCLKFLYLQNACESRKMSCSSGSFSRLECLVLESIPIEEMEIEEGAMPNLKDLSFLYCGELGVPQGLQYLTNLQKFTWTDVDETNCSSFLNSALSGTTKFGPHDLLTVLKQIEAELGRTNGIRYRLRPIDLDILFYEFGKGLLSD